MLFGSSEYHFSSHAPVDISAGLLRGFNASSLGAVDSGNVGAAGAWPSSCLGAAGVGPGGGRGSGDLSIKPFLGLTKGSVSTHGVGGGGGSWALPNSPVNCSGGFDYSTCSLVVMTVRPGELYLPKVRPSLIFSLRCLLV